MKLPNPVFLAFPSAFAAMALGGFLWLGASPTVRAVVVEARPLGGLESGLSLGFSLQEDHFHQRAPARGGTLAVSLDTLDAHLEQRLSLDPEGRGTLVFPFDLARARSRRLSVRLEASVVDGERSYPLPPGYLHLVPAEGAANPADDARFQLPAGGREGPRTLQAHASQWPPPVEQAFEVDWRVDDADAERVTLRAVGDEGVTVERIASSAPGLLRTRVFVPPLARTLSVVLDEGDGRTSTWRGTLPNPPANLAVTPLLGDGEVSARVRSNAPEGSYGVELVDTKGLVAQTTLVVTPGADGFGAADLHFSKVPTASPLWLVVRETVGSDAKLLAPVVADRDRLAVLEGRTKPNLDRWKAFDDFGDALSLAKKKRRRAIAGAIGASFVGSFLTLVGVLGRRRGQREKASLTIDGSRSVVDETRGRPLLVLLVVVLVAMVALAASLSDL